MAGLASAMDAEESAPAPTNYVATTSAEGAAITYITAWLQATQGDQDLVEATTGEGLPAAPVHPVAFSHVAVADAQRTSGQGVVSVTISALVDVANQNQQAGSEQAQAPPGPDEAAGTTPRESGFQVQYWQVAVYESAQGHMQVVGLPTPVPAPERSEQELSLGYPERLEMGSELAQMVDGFLQSYAAGEGDTSRYVSAGSAVHGITPAPYEQVEVMDLRAEHGLEETSPAEPLRLLVQAEAELRSEEGDRQAISLALTVQEQEGRWEVMAVDPAPLILDQTP